MLILARKAAETPTQSAEHAAPLGLSTDKRYNPIWSDPAQECSEIVDADRRVTSDRDVWRKPFAFAAGAGRLWVLNRRGRRREGRLPHGSSRRGCRVWSSPFRMCACPPGKPSPGTRSASSAEPRHTGRWRAGAHRRLAVVFRLGGVRKVLHAAESPANLLSG